MKSQGATLFAIVMFSLSFAFAPATAQAEGDIVVQSLAEVEREVADAAGRKVKKREAVKVAVPGSEVIYTTRFTNKGGKPAGNVVIDNPVPKDTTLVAGSAFGANTAITYSVNGGKSYDTPAKLRVATPDGKGRAAGPEDYTHIRWRYTRDLAPGQSGEVGFRVVIK